MVSWAPRAQFGTRGSILFSFLILFPHFQNISIYFKYLATTSVKPGVKQKVAHSLSSYISDLLLLVHEKLCIPSCSLSMVTVIEAWKASNGQSSQICASREHNKIFASVICLNKNSF